MRRRYSPQEELAILVKIKINLGLSQERFLRKSGIGMFVFLYFNKITLYKVSERLGI